MKPLSVITWGGRFSNVSVLVAIGVNARGYRKILGVAEGYKEDRAGWSNFLRHLKKRGLKGVRLFFTDACLGLVESFKAKGQLSNSATGGEPQGKTHYEKSLRIQDFEILGSRAIS